MKPAPLKKKWLQDLADLRAEKASTMRDIEAPHVEVVFITYYVWLSV